MALGLTAQLPEQAAAASFDSGARDVGQPPASPSIGLKLINTNLTAQPPPVAPADMSEPQPLAMDSPPPLSTAPPAAAADPATQDKNYYDFENSPVRSVGRALAEFGAGFQGNPSPAAAWQKQKIEEQAMAYKQADLGLQSMESFSKVLEKNDPSTWPAIADHFQTMFGKLVPVNFKALGTAIQSGEIKNAGQLLTSIQGAGFPPNILASTVNADGSMNIPQIKKLAGIADDVQKANLSRETPEQKAADEAAVTNARNAADANKPETFNDQPVEGINPATNKPELFKAGNQNTIKWLGIAPKPSKDAVDNLSVPTMIGFTGPDGEEQQVAAVYDKTKKQYINASNGQPIVNPQNLRIIGNATGGGRSIAIAGRVTTAALDASSDIANMSQLPLGSTMGLFGNLPNTPLSALKRSTITTQAQQDMQTTMAGLSRAMSLLGSGGMQGSDSVMQSFDALQPKAGDTTLTIMRKLGSFRQQAVNGIDSALASPLYGKDQKKQLQAAKDNIVKSIPWTPSDVTALQGKGPNATMSSIFSAKLSKGSAATTGTTKSGVGFKILGPN